MRSDPGRHVEREAAAHGERPAEPDQPMLLDGAVTAGDTEFMLRCFFEELLRTGLSAERLEAMCENAHFQALHAARAALGGARTREILADCARRVGVHRFTTREEGG